MKTHNVDFRITYTEHMKDSLIKEVIDKFGALTKKQEDAIDYYLDKVDLPNRYMAYSEVWGRNNTMSFGASVDQACDKVINKLRSTINPFEKVIKDYGLYTNRDQKFFDFPKTKESLSVVIDFYRIRYTPTPRFKIQLHCALIQDGCQDHYKWEYFVFTSAENFTNYIWHKRRGVVEEEMKPYPDKFYV